MKYLVIALMLKYWTFQYICSEMFYDHLIETLGIMIKLDLCMILADICWRWSIPGSFLMMINDDVTIYTICAILLHKWQMLNDCNDDGNHESDDDDDVVQLVLSHPMIVMMVMKVMLIMIVTMLLNLYSAAPAASIRVRVSTFIRIIGTN